MSSFLVGLLSALVATNPPAAVSNLVTKATGAAVSAAEPDENDPVEREYRKLLADDNAAHAEVDQWIRENEAFEAQGAGVSGAALAQRVQQRLEPVRKAYEDFLLRHGEHVRARLAFGSFLDGIREEDGAVAQWEKAKELDPKNPAAWNNLANHYGHRGPATKAFEHYERAIALDPEEPVYRQNLATTVYLFRADAKEFYHLDEEGVFARALDLYRQALKLDPENFLLAQDLAQTYYGIKPKPTPEARAKWKADALAAWNDAMKIAPSEFEREGVHLHLARIELNNGGFVAAREHLGAVTNESYMTLKARLARNLDEKEKKGGGTNAAPAAVEKN